MYSSFRGSSCVGRFHSLDIVRMLIEYVWDYRLFGARFELVGGGGRSDGGVFIMSWKLSSVAGSLEM